MMVFRDQYAVTKFSRLAISSTYFVFMLFAFYGWNRELFVGFARDELSDSAFSLALLYLAISFVLELVVLLMMHALIQKEFGLNTLRQLVLVVRHDRAILFCIHITVKLTLSSFVM